MTVSARCIVSVTLDVAAAGADASAEACGVCWFTSDVVAFSVVPALIAQTIAASSFASINSIFTLIHDEPI
jgi:hypothetical protein